MLCLKPVQWNTSTTRKPSLSCANKTEVVSKQFLPVYVSQKNNLVVLLHLEVIWLHLIVLYHLYSAQIESCHVTSKDQENTCMVHGVYWVIYKTNLGNKDGYGVSSRNTQSLKYHLDFDSRWEWRCIIAILWSVHLTFP